MNLRVRSEREFPTAIGTTKGDELKGFIWNTLIPRFLQKPVDVETPLETRAKQRCKDKARAAAERLSGLVVTGERRRRLNAGEAVECDAFARPIDAFAINKEFEKAVTTF